MDTTPDSHYLLDTNSLFYLVQTELDSTKAAFKTNADILKAGSLYISAITRVEVFSALGKTIRGKPEVRQPCGRMTITQNQEGRSVTAPCMNTFYQPKERRWSRTKVATAAVKQVLNNNSADIRLSVLPFDSGTIAIAERIIVHALQYNFASMDAMIAATAKQASDNGLTGIKLITADKSLKKCLEKVGIPYWDAFQGWKN